jgi:F0F1-type ATP synthase assembly protein I
MIKTLLDADENPPPETAVIIEETVLQPTDKTAAEPFVANGVSAGNEDILEIPGDYQNALFEPQNASEIFDAPMSAPAFASSFETPVVETKAEGESNPETSSRPENVLFASQTESLQPETTAETIRNSGLAYAAAVILLGSVIFMLILGWFADLLLGTEPWGIVVGIVLGSIIGFVQFFRTTSQILKNKG